MRLSSLLQDGLVLQRGKELTIWGGAEADSLLEIEFLGIKKETTAAEDGTFVFCLPPQPAGGPYELVLREYLPLAECPSGEREPADSRIIRNVYLGDVYVLGGQSNMELPLARTIDLYEAELSRRDDLLRMFEVPKEFELIDERKELAGGSWKVVAPENSPLFSTIGYFFGKELREETGVAIGLIQTAIGGTPCEAWISEPTLRELGGYDKELEYWKQPGLAAQVQEQEAKAQGEWYGSLSAQDAKGTAEEWKPWTLPGFFDGTELARFIGCLWFKKSVTLTAEDIASVGQHGNAARLILGTMIDADDVFVNGVRVGGTGYLYPPRKYPFDGTLLREGENEIRIRLTVNGGGGGFTPDKKYQLELPERIIPLFGVWEYQIGAEMSERAPGQTFFTYKPAAPYRAMIAPLRHLRVSGVCFYQGESNSGKPKGYHKLVSALAKDWRKVFAEETLPFFIMQLANFSDCGKDAGVNWAELREEQRIAAKEPGIYLATAHDLGEYNDLHPLHKKEAGQRLAALAKKVVYGKEVVAAGPEPEEICFEAEGVRISWKGIGTGLRIGWEHIERERIWENKASAEEKGVLRGFELAGADGVFYPATAKLCDNQVLVTPKQPMDKITAVRYAWKNNPEEANLYNAENFPAFGFSTKYPA
ncbi:MAG: hypothetical protein IJY09_10285 [Lachnospiraceae bacterium]|nr:hypothetical protein [Lachnospiraceae bacterium]